MTKMSPEIGATNGTATNNCSVVHPLVSVIFRAEGFGLSPLAQCVKARPRRSKRLHQGVLLNGGYPTWEADAAWRVS